MTTTAPDVNLDVTTDQVPLDVITDQQTLLAALRHALLAVPTRPPVPVLAGLLITGAGHQLTLSTFDYETAIEQVITGTGVGRALVPARYLYDMVKDMTKGTLVRLHVADGVVNIDGDGVTYTAELLNLDDYPPLPEVSEVHVGTISADTLAGLADVVTMAGKDVTLPILSAVRITPGEGTLRFLATDRYRLAALDVEDVTAAGKPLTVDATAINDVLKVFKGRGVTITRTANEYDGGRVSFTDGVNTLTSRLVEGDYPRVDSIFPDPATLTTTMLLDVKATLLAIKQVSKVCERNEAVRFVVGENDAVALEAGNGQRHASKPLNAVVDTNHGGTISFNPSFLVDTIKATGGEQVQIGFTSMSRPGLFTNPDRPGFQVIQMPVRLAA